MEQIVTKLVSEFEQGKLSRRQLIKNLTLAVTAGSALSAVPNQVVTECVLSFPLVLCQSKTYQNREKLCFGRPHDRPPAVISREGIVRTPEHIKWRQPHGTYISFLPELICT